jgi:TPP-dependent pyruvate/acetoin dehydrogenase alpha subunit
MFDAQLYRDKAEVEAWRHKEPIVRFRGWLEANGMIHADDLARIEADVAAEIAAAVAFAEAGTWEPVDALTRFTYWEQAA